MGNKVTSDRHKKPRSIVDLEIKVGEYRTINEGDPEMREDPEFPKAMMEEILATNTSIDGGTLQGTYVFYPNKTKPKMWIGNYKVVNPEDIICKTVAEKIGLTEEEWRNYIKNKQINEKGDDKTKVNANFDEITCEIPIELKENLEKANIDYVTMENNNIPYYDESEFIQDPDILNKIYNSLNNSNLENLHEDSYLMNGYTVDKSLYLDNAANEEEDEETVNQEEIEVESEKKTNEVKENAKIVKKMSKSSSYVNKLNKLTKTVNVSKEKLAENRTSEDRHGKPKYTENNVFSPKNKTQRNVSKNIKPKKCDKRDILAELINENKNKYQHKINTINKKNKDLYKNLASLSTKESFESKKKTKKNITSVKNVYNNSILVK
ncbi:conserved protein, unknown function [Hepatocystis sp. ex Piliocolobus tephrosceles]|nr:conserved protein, unknown function [Hepatocystis sp. ex Piliocolobus tephrosceles]